MPLSITILTEGSLTASVVGQGIVASIVPSQALLEVNVGVPGASATVSVGTTTTGDAGTDASVVNVGTTTAAILDFTIPRGDKGDQGDAAVIYVGTTSTLSAGSPATVTNSGTTQNAVFNFGIPQGYQGVKGDTGSQGEPGVGVPAGGTFGQGLIKTSNTFDYETAWAGPFVSLVDTGLQGMAGTLQVQGLDLDGNNISNVETIQVATVNVTYGTSPKIHFGSGDQITPWIEAPSDGEIYGRKDGAWEIVSGGGGGTWGSITGTLSSQTDLQNALNDKLSLSGGNMTGDIAFLVDGNGDDTAVGSFGLGTENTDGKVAYIEPQQIRIYDNDHLTGTSLNGTGITFNDETVQVTAGLPLTGGTVTDGITQIELFPVDGWIKIYDNVSPVGMALSSSSINFADNTVQTTAGLPLTGGTMTGDIVVNQEGLTPPEVRNSTLSPTGLSIYDVNSSEETQTFSVNLSGIQKTGAAAFSLLADFGLVMNNGISLTPTDGLTLKADSASKITFQDLTEQNTAWLGYNGTTSQYIRGDGSLYTFPPLGDRYLTSSTSTLTCDSGNGKTMTVGTGLSYSRQQDITVSYDTANHMHGTVLTYNSTTGVMTFDSNTHSGGGTYSNWEVNVGGVAGAILPVGGSAGQVLAKINSTNFNTEWISLGSMAQATTTDYLAKADNLSGLASTTTARTNLGLGAVATDSYATTAQAQAGTSTTTVINPSTLLDARYLAGARFAGYTTWTASTSGTGASAGTAFTKSVTAPTSATGFGQSYTALQNGQRGEIYNNGIDFRKNIVFGGRFCRLTSGTVDSNSIFRCNLGRSVPITTAGDLSSRGVGIRIVGNTGVVELQVHNGTTLYNVASSFTPVYNQAFDVVIISNGSGTATLYINGTSVATSSNAPTTLLSANFSVYLVECQNTATLSNSAMSMNCSDQFLHISPI